MHRLKNKGPVDFSGKRIGISACLVGIACRYDGKSKSSDRIIQKIRPSQVIPFCPEVLAGLLIPRDPVAILTGDGHDVLAGTSKVQTSRGIDVTAAFLQGARQTEAILRKWGIEILILKEYSPSCGVNWIKRGGVCVKGAGILTAYCQNLDIEIVSSLDLEDS